MGRRVHLLACSVILLSASALCVCGEPHPRLVCGEYFQSKAVVEAKLIRSEYIASETDMDGHVYTMKTGKILRGQIDSSFQVWEENSSGRATFDWNIGDSYLLFFYAKQNRGWVLDGCGNSGPLAKAHLALHEIVDLPKRHGGMIQVGVGGNWIVGGPISDVKVSANGTPGSFFATTDAKGIAEIHVPTGQYSVSVPNENVVPFDFTYDDPRKVVIENGSCAQVQFVKTSNSE